MADPKRSWLDGPSLAGSNDESIGPGQWPGQKMGLPQKGPGALASVLRRCGGITLDWLLCLFVSIILSNFTSVTSALGGVSTMTLVFFCVVSVVCVTLFARTPGQAMMGMGVARVDKQERVGFVRALVRIVLTVFIFPAIMVDEDGRGLHDRATQTAVILG